MHDPLRAYNIRTRAANEAHHQALCVIESAYDQARANAERARRDATHAANQALADEYEAAQLAYQQATDAANDEPPF